MAIRGKDYRPECEALEGRLAPAILVTGADAGTLPRVHVYDARTLTETFSFIAYEPSYRGGVRVAVADTNGDGVPDIITAPGVGESHVKVFDGRNASLLRDFTPYGTDFKTGIYVA